ncbi:carboxymuconolactone decarboxylase family protein [Flavobacterium sp. CLA17]|uniref:carboxymuconolactone decarboxylase family protein n=1 Tax=Flavobacterium sp. CLA17 TaxID=2724135 RepID=UPI001492202A|nr:carboxymuconolactone decarboxylase family protein [Flavobacterium sp. CLA17]QSB29226.1 carboxymuconolactone decarboxylase family protein [Flavobacterium sp. CLA17]
MKRIQALDPQKAEGEIKNLFDTVEQQLGMVPNMMRVMGNSPAVLNSYLLSCKALKESSIGFTLSEQIALTVAHVNGCDYCLTSHTFISSVILKIDPKTIELARKGESCKSKSQSVLEFVINLMQNKGKPSDAHLQALQKEGFDDRQITEIIAHTAFEIFTNFIANASQVAIDFPDITSNGLKAKI